MSVQKWHNEILGQRVVDALQKNGFKAIYFSEQEEAIEYVLNFIGQNTKVGIGGSITIEELGLHQKAVEKGATVFNHNEPGLTPEKRLEMRRSQLSCDVFLCSSNAITLDGYLVNTDATGNRVGAMNFGPQKVIVIAGINKICKDIDSALKRIELECAPKTNKRLNRPSPCVTTGLCIDCKGPTRICNIYTITKRKPSATDVEVVLIGQSLGF